MNAPGDKQPTRYEVRRASRHPIRISDAGALALSQIVIVKPAPEIKDEILQATSQRNHVRCTELNRVDDTEAVFEIRSYRQSVTSMAQISNTIRDLRAILNAAVDPDEYAKAIYGTPRFDATQPY